MTIFFNFCNEFYLKIKFFDLLIVKFYRTKRRLKYLTSAYNHIFKQKCSVSTLYTLKVSSPREKSHILL